MLAGKQAPEDGLRATLPAAAAAAASSAAGAFLQAREGGKEGGREGGRQQKTMLDSHHELGFFFFLGWGGVGRARVLVFLQAHHCGSFRLDDITIGRRGYCTRSRLTPATEID